MKGDIFSWNSSLSQTLNTISAQRRHAAKNSSMLWTPWFPGLQGLRAILPESVVVPQKALRQCFACTLCRPGSICLMLLLKMPFMTAMPCGLSCALISTRNSSCLIVKKYFGYVKVAYRGLAKNLNRFNQRFLNSVPCNFWRNHEYWFKNFT